MRVGFAATAFVMLSASECHVEPPVLVEELSEVEELAYPQAAFDGNGQVMVVGHQLLRRGQEVPQSLGILAKRYDFVARAFVETVVVDREGLTFPRVTDIAAPSLAVDESGQATAVWRCSRCQYPGQHFFARYLPGGGWSPVAELDTDERAIADARVAMDGSGRALLGLSGRGVSFVGAHVQSSGFVDTVMPFGSLPDNGPPPADVAYWSDGVGLAAWIGAGGEVLATRFVRSSAVWETPVQVALDPAGAGPRLAYRATAPSAGAMLGWRRGADGIFTSRYVPGAGWEAAVQVPESAGAKRFDLAMAANGEVVVVWSRRVAPAEIIESARWAAGVWASVDTETGTPWEVTGLQVALDAGGNGILVLSDWLGGTWATISSARYRRGGTWSERTDVGTAHQRPLNPHDASSFDLAMDDAGRALVVWESAPQPADADTDLKVHIFGRPVARFTYTPREPIAGQPARFDATTSTHDNGAIVAYDWDIDGNGTFEYTGVAPEIWFPAAGQYAVRLRVTGDDGDTDEDWHSVTVRPPVATTPSTRFTLRITVTRNGGFVGSADGELSCGTAGPATCSVQYAAGAVVNVYASSLMGANVLFESWGGDCAGGPNLTLTMNRDYTCSAVFASGP